MKRILYFLVIFNTIMIFLIILVCSKNVDATDKLNDINNNNLIFSVNEPIPDQYIKLDNDMKETDDSCTYIKDINTGIVYKIGFLTNNNIEFVPIS